MQRSECIVQTLVNPSALSRTPPYPASLFYFSVGGSILMGGAFLVAGTVCCLGLYARAAKVLEMHVSE